MIPGISIIINHYRSPTLLKNCLQSIREHVRGVSHETIVVDSAALPETKQMMAEDFSDVKYIPFEKNIGFGRSVNAGIAQSSAPYLFIVNADLVLMAGTLERLLKTASESSDAALVGPKLLNFDGTVQPSAFRFYTPLVVAARRTLFGKTPLGKKVVRAFLLERELVHERQEPVPVDWVMGSAMFVKREAVDRIGMLDERFFMYFEDVDWCRRFWEAGYKVYYLPQAVCYHYHKRVSKGRGGVFELLTNPYTRVHLASAVKYFAKHGLKTPRYGI